MTAFKNLCTARGLTITAKRGAKLPVTERSQWMLTATDWRVTLRYQRRVLSCDFFMGRALVNPPEAPSVLESLFGDADLGRDTFEGFCAKLGESPDSRKAYKTWKKCAAMAGKIARFFGDDLALFEESARNE
jgi:hypothetical protein